MAFNQIESLDFYVFNVVNILKGAGVFIKIFSKSTFQLFLIEGSDSYQKFFTK